MTDNGAAMIAHESQKGLMRLAIIGVTLPIQFHQVAKSCPTTPRLDNRDARVKSIPCRVNLFSDFRLDF
jgi:hypothetical protein